MPLDPEVASLAPNILHSFASAPQSVSDPWAILAGGAATAAYAAYQWHRADPERVEGLAHNPSNPGAVRKAVIDVTNGEDRNGLMRERFYRVGSSLALGIGSILVATAAVANPSFATEVEIPSANTVVVLDTSNSMVGSSDMPGSTSRFDFARSSIASSGFNGNMAVVQFGNGSKDYTSVPLEAFDPNTILTSVKPNAVDNNGADLSDAMTSAANQLPHHQGKEVVITDGIGVSNDSPNSISSVVANLENEGIDVQIDVIGTSGTKTNPSTYVVNYGTAPATPDITPFAGVKPSELHISPNGQSVAGDIKAAIGKPARVKEHHFYYPSLIPGIGLLVYGCVRDLRQRLRKFI